MLAAAKLLNESLSDTASGREALKRSAAPQAPAAGTAPDDQMTFAQYKKARSTYVRQTGATPPPGATPLEKLADCDEPSGGEPSES